MYYNKIGAQPCVHDLYKIQLGLIEINFSTELGFIGICGICELVPFPVSSVFGAEGRTARWAARWWTGLRSLGSPPAPPPPGSCPERRSSAGSYRRKWHLVAQCPERAPPSSCCTPSQRTSRTRSQAHRRQLQRRQNIRFWKTLTPSLGRKMASLGEKFRVFLPLWWSEGKVDSVGNQRPNSPESQFLTSGRLHDREVALKTLSLKTILQVFQ